MLPLARLYASDIPGLPAPAGTDVLQAWTAVLDAVRLAPGADVAAVTTVQIRDVVGRLVAAGQRKPGVPEVLVVPDPGYDAPRIAHLAVLTKAPYLPDHSPACTAPL